jgi:predicted acylesterase/phospholipase RssA
MLQIMLRDRLSLLFAMSEQRIPPMPDEAFNHWPQGRTVALVLAGGAALGAYEAGGALLPTWLASSSIGSLNAAIIAGNEPASAWRSCESFGR